jgi:hypothetical protein
VSSLAAEIKTGLGLALRALVMAFRCVPASWPLVLPWLLAGLAIHWTGELRFENALPAMNMLDRAQSTVLGIAMYILTGVGLLAAGIGAWRTVSGRQARFGLTFRGINWTVLWAWVAVGALWLGWGALTDWATSQIYQRILLDDVLRQPLSESQFLLGVISLILALLAWLIGVFLETAVPHALADGRRPIRMAMASGYRNFACFAVATGAVQVALIPVSLGLAIVGEDTVDVEPALSLALEAGDLGLAIISGLAFAWLSALLWHHASKSDAE